MDAAFFKNEKKKVARSIPNIFNCFLRNSPDGNLMLLISPKMEINWWMHKLWKHTIDITYHLSLGNILLSSVLSSPLCVDQMPELVLQASWQNLQIKKWWAPSVELWINFVHIVADICTTHTWFETRSSNKHCQKAFALTQIYLYTTTFICPRFSSLQKNEESCLILLTLLYWGNKSCRQNPCNEHFWLSFNISSRVMVVLGMASKYHT